MKAVEHQLYWVECFGVEEGMRLLFFGWAWYGCSSEEPDNSNKETTADSAEEAVDDATDTAQESLDPMLDSDGDGYTDVEELHAGTDPHDAEDSIYQGGWPYNMNKSEMQSSGWDSTPSEGAMLPEYIAQDQFGDSVNLYDLAGRGKKIVLDVGTEFCTPCKDLAAYLSTNDMSHLVWNDEGEYYPWWKTEYSHLYQMVQDEEVYWVTILFSENEPFPTSENAASWEENFPNEKIIVLADTDLTMFHYLDIQSFPAISVLDENMNFLLFSNSSPATALREVCLE